MGLFSSSQMDQINEAAKKSNQSLKTASRVSPDSINRELNESTEAVLDYFRDSQSILINNVDQLHEYVSECIEVGIAGIDTETTGLDRVNDIVVGASLYYPGGTECYIPINHKAPIFEQLYKNQLTFEEVGEEFQRMVDADVKFIFANADFDLAMIYKDFKVDMCDVCYYDVIIAWRCIKEDEPRNGLKELYNKYVLKGEGDPKKFTDFFSPKLFPYCRPEVAKLYAANDAKITYELYSWQVPYITKSNPKCQKKQLEHIADLIWNVEFPLIKVCQIMHRTGLYLDKDTAKVLNKRYGNMIKEENAKLAEMVQEVIDNSDAIHQTSKPPFLSGKDFNPQSPPQVKYLLYTLMDLPNDGNGGTGKELLRQLNLPITDQILKVRSLGVLMNTFVRKLPNAATPDSRIHAQMRQIGADCVAGDTVILLARKDSLFETTIGDLYESCGSDIVGEHISLSDTCVINRNYEPECADSIIKYEDFETITVICDHGYSLEGTYNHPIMIDTQHGDTFVNLENVRVGDSVLVSKYGVKDHVPVTEIKYGRCDVYDLHVPGTHSFISNGIVSHNTGRLSCSDPNVMNIPSHASDIRHLFRATDARNLEIDCQSDETGVIEVELSRYDKLYNQQDELVKVYDLSNGDKIKLLTGSNEPQYKEIISVEQCQDDLSHQILRIRE